MTRRARADGGATEKNGLPQGIVLAPLLFNVYILTINLRLRTAAGPYIYIYIYADDLCITTQQSDLQHVEHTLALALDEMSIYYSRNLLKPNTAKTQICCFHMRNRYAKHKLNVTWNGVELDNYPNHIYLGVTLARTLSFKQTRHNLLRKLTNPEWGAHPATVRTTALALCFSTAEFACSSWGRSRHTWHVDIALNDTCRIITGCLNATPIPCLFSLAGIAPPDIRRKVASNADSCLQEDYT